MPERHLTIFIFGKRFVIPPSKNFCRSGINRNSLSYTIRERKCEHGTKSLDSIFDSDWNFDHLCRSSLVYHKFAGGS